MRKKNERSNNHFDLLTQIEVEFALQCLIMVIDSKTEKQEKLSRIL